MRAMLFPMFAAMLCATAALAAQGVPDPTAAAGAPDLMTLKRQIESGQAAEAEGALRQANARDPGNADILNLLGFANRKLERWDTARSYYGRALAIDPRHKGAMEYMGELELETGDVKAARALLARLRILCPSGCHELDDLIDAFEDRGIKPDGGER